MLNSNGAHSSPLGLLQHCCHLTVQKDVEAFQMVKCIVLSSDTVTNQKMSSTYYLSTFKELLSVSTELRILMMW